MHVRIASDTQAIKSFDWSKWHCALWPFVATKHQFRLSDKPVVNTSIIKNFETPTLINIFLNIKNSKIVEILKILTSLYEASRSTSAQSVSRNRVSKRMNFWNSPYSWDSRSSSWKTEDRGCQLYPGYCTHFMSKNLNYNILKKNIILCPIVSNYFFVKL